MFVAYGTCWVLEEEEEGERDPLCVRRPPVRPEASNRYRSGWHVTGPVRGVRRAESQTSSAGQILEISLDLLHSAAGAQNSRGAAQVGRCKRRAAGAGAGAAGARARRPRAHRGPTSCRVMRSWQNSRHPGFGFPSSLPGSLHKSLNSLGSG